MKLSQLSLNLVFAFSASGCAVLPTGEAQKASSASIINFKQDTDQGTKVAQLMCLNQHITLSGEHEHSLQPGTHKIYIRIVDYSDVSPSSRSHDKWQGITRVGSYVMLQAPLTAGQAVSIQRRDKNGKSYIWLQDRVTGKSVSEVKNTTLQSQFKIHSDLLERECAKGTT